MVFTRVCEIRDSSNIIMAEYAMEDKTLRLSFKDGSVYQYEGIDRSIFGDLVSWPSVGTFFQTYIRGHFDTAKIM